jgi:hypothetical protein
VTAFTKPAMALRVAGSLGWQVDEVIKRVDIYPAPVAMEMSDDGTRAIAGHKLGYLSKPLHEFLAARMPDTPRLGMDWMSKYKGLQFRSGQETCFATAPFAE